MTQPVEELRLPEMILSLQVRAKRLAAKKSGGRGKLSVEDLVPLLQTFCTESGIAHDLPITKTLLYQATSNKITDHNRITSLSDVLNRFAESIGIPIRVSHGNNGTGEYRSEQGEEGDNHTAVKFYADHLGSADPLDGIWRMFYIRQVRLPSGKQQNIVQSNLAFFTKHRFHSDIYLIADSMIWEGRCFANDLHLYFVWNESKNQTGSSFMMSNKPSKADPVIAGLALTPDFFSESFNIKPISATFCFAHRCDIDELIRKADESERAALRVCMEQLLQGKPPGSDEANMIRRVYRIGYTEEEKFKNSERDTWNFLRNLEVGGVALSDFSNLLGLEPFKLKWS